MLKNKRKKKILLRLRQTLGKVDSQWAEGKRGLIWRFVFLQRGSFGKKKIT